jgi:hypothetical protein
VCIAALHETNAEWNQYGFREQYAKAYCDHTTASKHLFTYSSEMAEGTYFKMGGTSITVIDRLTQWMHKSGQDATGVGRWSWFTVLGKNNAKMIFILCYKVCPTPVIHLIGISYFQPYRIMEQEDESQLALLEPRKQKIRYLQVFMLQHIEHGFTANLAMDGNESSSHSYRAPTVDSRITIPLGFNYDERISGSIADMLEA